jgi:branched-chain amino acid transport system permease protein
MYALQILILIGIYSIAAMGTNLVVGYTGLISVTQAALFGIGAYAAALMATNLTTTFPAVVLAGIVVATAAAVQVAGLSLRLSHDYFVIATIGFQLVVWSIFNNWQEVTRGPLGIPGIPPPSVFGYEMNHPILFGVLVISCAIIAFFICSRLVRSPYGRVLLAIREDDDLVRALGKNPLFFKVTIFSVAGALCGLAGTLYAQFATFIDPTSFTITESVFILSIVIIGGSGNLWGPILGSVILVTLPEALRFIGLPSAEAANLRQIIYGVLLIAMMMVRPRGLIGNYGFGR